MQSSAEAKAWLIQQILSEATHTGDPLDSLEARMLEYSETEGTPPDHETLNEAFDQSHDQGDYEEKVAAIIRRMLANWKAEGDPRLTRWNEAIQTISSQDHYLLVLAGIADNRLSIPTQRRAGLHWLRLFGIAIVVTVLLTLLLGHFVMR
jgi:hypothetical protein